MASVLKRMNLFNDNLISKKNMNKITIQKLPVPESGTVRRPTPLLPVATLVQVPSSAGLSKSSELGVKRTIQERLRMEFA